MKTSTFALTMFTKQWPKMGLTKSTTVTSQLFKKTNLGKKTQDKSKKQA